MKYYLAFISLNSRTRASIQGFQIMPCPLDWEYDESSDIWFALYAWTNEKKIMKEFKRQRSKEYFIYKKIDSSHIDDEFEKGNTKIKLSKYNYASGRKGREDSIVSTEFENTTSSDEGLIFEAFFKDHCPDPLLFKNDILFLLERFGYSYVFFNYCVDSIPMREYDDIELSDYDMELYSRQDVFWNNYSYMDIEEWKYINEKNMKCNGIKVNEFEVFIKLYGELFKV